jgi:hypothetical protein
MYQPDFSVKLAQQHEFMQNSCRAYDTGSKAEAIRIATIIRVLFHDSRRSTSLLTHLGATGVRVLSAVPARPAGAIDYFFGMGAGELRDDGSVELVPNFDTGPPGRMMAAKDWWQQPVFALRTGETLTRRDIVLAAANQDGGAYVDTEVAPAYSALATNGAGGTRYRVVGDHLELDNSRNLHWVSLRQMAYELLESPAL